MELGATERGSHVISAWRISLIGIFCFSALLYLPSIGGKPFWDDAMLLSSTGASHQSFAQAVRLPFLDSYFRPLTAVSLALDGQFGGQSPAYFHSTNVLLHALTSSLVACLGLLLTDSRRAGFASGIIFAIQPWQVGATAWIGGRPDVLATFFLSLSLTALVADYRSPGKLWLAFSAATYLLAALAKEQCLAILPIFPLSEYVFGSGHWRRALRVSVPFVLCALMFGWLYANLDPVAARTLPRSAGAVFVQFVLTVTHYFRAICVPNRAFFVTYNLQSYDSIGWMILGTTITAGIVVGFVWLLRFRPVLAWLAAIALCASIPASNLVGVPLLVGPYRVAAAGPAVACFLEMLLFGAFVRKHWVVAGLIVANLVAAASATSWGIHQWSDGFRYFSEVMSYNPAFTLGRAVYVDELMAAGRPEEAIRQVDASLTYIFDGPGWRQKIRTSPTGVLPADAVERLKLDGARADQAHEVAYLLYDRAAAHESLARVDAAREDLRDALGYWPDNALLHFMYGQCLIPVDRAAAFHNLREACRLKPANLSYALVLVPLELQDRRWSDAETDAHLFEKQMPQVAISWMFDADAAMQLGDFARAEADLRSAKGKPIRDPSDLELRWNRLRKLEEAHRAPVARTLP